MDLVGGRVGSYQIIAHLARGGFGIIYRGAHEGTGTPAAIKVLDPVLRGSWDMIERFQREVRAIERIDHPNIVSIFESGQLDDGRPWYAMELLEGRDLATLVGQTGGLSPREVYDVFEQVCAALSAAHEAGFIHRDLKPANVFVVSGTPLVVKLLDFGIAKLIHPEPGMGGQTSASITLGTPVAMAPEQILGGLLDARTDVYALGVLLYFALTGVYPFDGRDAVEIEGRHLTGTPPRPSAVAPVSPPLDDVVLRCLQKHPDRRFPSALAFLKALSAAIPERASADTIATPEAIAVYVRAITDEEAGPDEIDDAVAVVESAEAYLSGAGFAIPMKTATDLLAVRPLPAAGEVAERQRVIDLALALHERLKQRPNAHPQVRATIRVHRDQVRIRTDGAIVGGPIMEVAAWADTESAEIRATPESVKGLVNVTIPIEPLTIARQV